MSNDALEGLKRMKECFNPYFMEQIEGKKHRLADEKSSQKLLLDFGDLQHSIVLSIDKDRDRNDSSGFGGIAPDKLFPFFNPKVPGITEKNDFILMACHKECLYVFLLEMKSGTKNDYLKQMKAGLWFIDLVVNLLGLHGQLVDTVKPRYFGILSLSGKKSPNLGGTRHDNISFNDRNGLLVSEWTDDSINVKSLINAANRAVS
ncbi:MAG: hypothetical protein WCI11_12130 [Candidatus Methylumidiphilus sp.]